MLFKVPAETASRNCKPKLQADPQSLPPVVSGILLMLIATVFLACMHSIVRYLTAELHHF